MKTTSFLLAATILTALMGCANAQWAGVGYSYCQTLTSPLPTYTNNTELMILRMWTIPYSSFIFFNARCGEGGSQILYTMTDTGGGKANITFNLPNSVYLSSYYGNESMPVVYDTTNRSGYTQEGYNDTTACVECWSAIYDAPTPYANTATVNRNIMDGMTGFAVGLAGSGRNIGSTAAFAVVVLIGMAALNKVVSEYRTSRKKE